MSSASPRKSVDSLASGLSTPSLSQFSLNQIDSPRAPPQRYPLRRGSTASSLASIGGILDSAHPHEPIAEAGQNGLFLLAIVICALGCVLIHLYSDLNPSSAPNRSDRIATSYRGGFDRLQASKFSRYTTGDANEHSACGIQGLPTILIASWLFVRCVSTGKRK